MSLESHLAEDCGKANSNVPADNIKLDNPYVGKEPFKVTYGRDEPPNITYLLTGEYSRIWNREHDQYMKKRQIEKTTTNFIKPDVNARKPTKTESNEPKPVVRSKKYENVQSKIDNGK